MWYAITRAIMSKKAVKESGRTIQSVKTACSLVETLQELGDAGTTEIAQQVDAPKSVVYNHLSTLCECGLVIKDGEKYRLSLRFFNIGEEIRNRRTVFQVARPKVEDMANESGEFAHLFVREGTWGYTLHRAKGSEAIATTSRIGKRSYLHRTAAGKAILAHTDKEQVERIIEARGLPAQTENTITQRDELFTELKKIRDNGVAISDEECVKGARSVGAPIIGPTNEVLGAISISGPVARLDDDRVNGEISELVYKTANFIEITISTQEEPSLS
jgi:DNA-binding IclR family transcriptional regulator